MSLPVRAFLVSVGVVTGLLGCGSNSDDEADASTTSDANTSADGASGNDLELVDCASGAEANAKACGTFTTDLGTEIKLGPYGAATEMW